MTNKITKMIHPTALIHPKAKIATNARIGAYCVVGEKVEIGEESVLEPHCVIAGRTKIGKRNHIYSFAAIGYRPQDLKYKGEDTSIEIGDDNEIREYVVVHIGTKVKGSEGITKIGNKCLIMTRSHIAHDCFLGDNVIIGDGTGLAGHIHIDKHAIIGGMVGIAQFTRIGAYAFVNGKSALTKDVLPFSKVEGYYASFQGINVVGMRRSGFSNGDIMKTQSFCRELFETEETFQVALRRMQTIYMGCKPVQMIFDFIQGKKRYAICAPLGKGKSFEMGK